MHPLKITKKKNKKKLVGAHLGTIKKLVCFFVRVVNFGYMGKIGNLHETSHFPMRKKAKFTWSIVKNEYKYEYT
jgi:hypothetical protein